MVVSWRARLAQWSKNKMLAYRRGVPATRLRHAPLLMLDRA